MCTPLQEQLLKAGLVKKHKVAEAVREQARQLHSKAPAPAAAAKVDTQRLQAERAERDRALSAERNAQARANELRAQVRQIVQSHKIKIKREGEIAYGFSDGGKIRNVLVNETLRAQLASGALVVVRHDQGYELLPRAAAAMVYERDGAAIVLDHGRAAADSKQGEDDEYYKQFAVPDDLIW